jgi:dipeptide/tripeptide permease
MPRTRSTKSLIFFLAFGSLLGLSLYPYLTQEVVVCWLLFSLAFVSVAVVIFAGVLVYCACQWAIHWASSAAHEAPKVVLAPPELHLEIIPEAEKLK